MDPWEHKLNHTFFMFQLVFLLQIEVSKVFWSKYSKIAIFSSMVHGRKDLSEMKKRKPDFIIQLGDFSLPRKQNQLFIDKWNSFNGPKYHVLGNHDMKDFGYKKVRPKPDFL